MCFFFFFFFFQAEDGIRDLYVTGVQTCALPIFGDQAGSTLPAPSRVSCRGRPPAAETTKRSKPRPRSAANAIRRPSGDHAGSVALPAPAARKVVDPPRGSIVSSRKPPACA